MLCTSLIIVIVGNTVLNVALPTLQQPLEQGGLGATNTEVQWIVDAYGLVFAGLLFTAAALGDRFGRKGALQAGLVVFAAGSALGAFADDPAMLIVARAVMGIGAAFVMPSTLSILTNVFPRRERAKAIAIWAGISGSGAALGPLASGLLLEHFWWGSVFLVNLPIIAGALVAGYVLVPKSKDTTRTPLDPVGALLSIVGLERAGVRHHRGARTTAGSSVDSLLWFGGAAIVLLAFVLVGVAQPPPDARPAAVPEPAVRRVVGRHHARVLRHVRDVLPARPVPAGRARLLAARGRRAPAAVLGGDDDRRPEHAEARRPASAPTASAWPGCCSSAPASSARRCSRPTRPTSQLALTMCVLAAGMAMTMTPMTTQLMAAVPRDRAGMGSATNDTTRELGGALGVAVLGSLLASQYTSGVSPAVAGLAGAGRRRSPRAASAACVGLVEQGLVPAQPSLDVARESFVDGLHAGGLVGAVRRHRRRLRRQALPAVGSRTTRRSPARPRPAAVVVD